ncbi:calcineurin-like phosphoesterase [Aureococcus anophagefferens]|nr:calcineurin-like phosphoesterase [Aureococcus anophagefferens]
MRYLSSLPARPRSALIVAGDVDDDVRVLTETLRVCVSKFGGGVFFTPGNHDLWLGAKARLAREARRRPEGRRGRGRVDDAEAPARSRRRALRAGDPAAELAPRAPDTEPALTCWGGLPTARQAMSDYHNCAWPAPLDDATESVARHFDALNDDAPADVDRATTAVVTFSHFLPRIELIPEKRFMFLPCLAECVGSRFLGDRVARLRPDVHVFGHTHLAWDATLDGVRYLQGCVGYPSEWATRPASLEIGRLRCCPVWDAAAGLAGYFGAKWSKHYEKYPRRPDVTHVLPPYSAARYAPLPGAEVRDVCDHVPPFCT